MNNRLKDSFGTRTQLEVAGKTYDIFELGRLGRDLSRLPYSIRILLENLLRNEDGLRVQRQDVEALLSWSPSKNTEQEISFVPARVILQDFTGVPAVCDLAAMRDAMVGLGGDPKKINPMQPVDLVIDHSVQVDEYGHPKAFDNNVALEFERNQERYELLRWAQTAFQGFRAVPPGTGIVHQVNLEYLAQVVFSRESDGAVLAYPDTLVGTDSHTTMINGAGVVGWGVGGIEAEAAMLGQPITMLIPDVVGFKLTGQLKPGSTATDLVLTVTQMLRKKGVVGKFVEFYGPGLDNLTLADRATIANMAPEYGATIGFFPVDAETLNYLRLSGRADEQVALVEAYSKRQGLWRTSDSPDPEFNDTLSLDISTVEPCLAGPKRPQDRVLLSNVQSNYHQNLPTLMGQAAPNSEAQVEYNGQSFALKHGAVVIAAITSCTNTSNPYVMLAAGMLAKKAVERGLKAQPWVKTSLAPGSQVVTEYLEASGLQKYLDEVGFNLVGYGCTTCIGNSGPLPEPVSAGVKDGNLVVAAVLSGNRNFEGRVNPQVKANYLASPPLVVAYALAGTVDLDLSKDPLGTDREGKPVYLSEIWPTLPEVAAVASASVTREQFQSRYGNVFAGNEHWRALVVPEGDRFEWKDTSTYIRLPSFFENMTAEPAPVKPIRGARALAVLGDSVTTDHISPAGNIAKDGPAAKYLTSHGVAPRDFNQYGARRGNHEVMVRGTFANIRLKNFLAPGTEGGVTQYLPEGTQMTIYDASMKYQAAGTPLLVFAGSEYGTGSSRDWAAKGTMLLGVKAVVVKSFERIHRSNLVGMGVLPLQFKEGEDLTAHGLTGRESFEIAGVEGSLKPGQPLTVIATADDGTETRFEVKCRIDTPQEVLYFEHGGVLPYVVRQLLKS